MDRAGSIVCGLAEHTVRRAVCSPIAANPCAAFALVWEPEGMDLVVSSMDSYLGADSEIESTHPQIVELAGDLRRSNPGDEAFARAAFEWVRDEVRHSVDAQDPRVTISATQVLRERVGLCYAKSHLLAALLRAEGIPAGLCYQRLGNEHDGFALHGLIAFYIDGAWHREDPRGNKPGIDAQFSVDGERLAYKVNADAGEVDYPTVYPQPSQEVIEVLNSADNVLELCRGGLPPKLGG
jgi:transglutaminase-like putative cysteine protease